MHTLFKNKNSYFLAISLFVLMIASMACAGHTETAVSMQKDSHMEKATTIDKYGYLDKTGQMLLDP